MNPLNLRNWLIALCAAGVALPLACSTDTSLFTNGGGAGVGGSGGSSSTQGGSGQGGTGQGGSSTSSGTGGGTTTTSSSSSSSSSGTGGGMTNCAHDICDEGGPLMNGCEPCVTQVCNDDPFCCTQSWDIMCTFGVEETCNIDCAPGVISCEDQYTPHPDVKFVCAQSGIACDLHTDISTQSCSTICAARGGECINAVNDVMQCGHGQQLGCNYVGFSTVVCTCSRGCGGGPPCGNLQTCVNGSCQ